MPPSDDNADRLIADSLARPIQVATPGDGRAAAKIPQNIRCVACLYCLDGCRQGPCPECGYPIGSAEIERWVRRERWADAFPLRRFYLAAAVVPFVYATGAGTFGNHTGPGFAAFIGLSATLCGTVLTGEILAWLGDSRDRRVTRRVWLRYASLLNLSWLVIAPCALIVLVIAGIESFSGGSGIATLMAAIFMLIMWLLGTFGALIAASAALGVVYANHALRWSRTQAVLITIAITLQFPANMFAGFVGGTLAVSGATRIAGLDWWNDSD